MSMKNFVSWFGLWGYQGVVFGIRSIDTSIKHNIHIDYLFREVPIEKSLIETTNTMAQFDEKDVLIQSLIDHIDAYENYIKNLENDHAMVCSA